MTDLFDELESMFEDTVIDDIPDVSQMEDVELVKFYAKQRQKIYDLGVVIAKNPDTQEARDAHSLRNAALLEMKKRGLN